MRSTPARARGRRSTSGPRQRAAAGDPTPGYDGYCRDLGLPRGEGRALRFRTPDEGVVRVDDLVRGEVEFPQRALEDFICVKGNGKPLFVLANVVDDRTMAITHVIRGEDLLPTHAAADHAVGGAQRGRGHATSPCPRTPICRCWSTSRARSSPSDGTRWRSRCTASRATCPRPSATTWRCLGWSPGDEEIVPVEEIIERFRLEDVQRSPAFFDIKKLSHINGVYIRALAVDEFVAAARPWVDPVPGEWAPGGWRDPDTGAPAVEPPPWPPERFDAGVFAALAAVTQERVTVLGEVPELVDFLFLEDAPDDPDSWQKAVAGDELAPRILAEALAAYETCPVGQGLAARGDAGHRGVGGPQARQGAGAHPGGGHGADAGPAAVRLAGGARPRRDAAPHRRRADPAAGHHLMLLAPLRWALRIAAFVAGGDRPLLRRDPGAGVADLAPVRPAPGGRHPGHGGGAVRRAAVTGPQGAPRRGVDALPRRLRAPHRGDRQQGAGGHLHRGAVGGDVPGERGACRRPTSSQAGGDDSYENIADAQPELAAHGRRR